VISVIIADDSAIYRSMLRKAFEGSDDIDVVSTALNGSIALKKIRNYKPDLVLLDFEMPELNGLEVLEQLKEEEYQPKVLMVSAHTAEAANLTIDALSAGAIDFIVKPTEDTPEASIAKLKEQIISRIDGIFHLGQREANTLTRTAPPAQKETARHVKIPKHSRDIIALGVSTGGPEALKRVIPQLPADFAPTILVTVHMPPVFTHSYAQALDRLSKITVKEAASGETALPGVCYIAPGDYHLKMDSGRVLSCEKGPYRNNCRPSVDVMFESLYDTAERTMAVIMTGMGSDGARGMQGLKLAGAVTIAQSGETCVVNGMPQSARALGCVDRVVPLNEIYQQIIDYAVTVS